jgi:ABC-type oligopeptide transport system substrate-binding subunit
MKRILIGSFLLCLVVVSCSSQTVTKVAPEIKPTNTPFPPTVTPAPTDTPEPTPTITPIPGVEVVPLADFEHEIPWLPLDEERRPITVLLGINLNKPPFDDVLVRKAFTAATDREAVTLKAAEYYYEGQPATTIIPASILGRDLYNDVGIPFDPAQAEAYLAEAGYPDGRDFPEVTILVYQRGDAAPSTYYRLALDVIAPLWEDILGVSVRVDSFPERILQLPAKVDQSQPDFYVIAWGADYADPDNIFQVLFTTGADWNLNDYANPAFDDLINMAAETSDPAVRQQLYIEAERILNEQDVPVVPLFHGIRVKQ